MVYACALVYVWYSVDMADEEEKSNYKEVRPEQITAFEHTKNLVLDVDKLFEEKVGNIKRAELGSVKETTDKGIPVLGTKNKYEPWEFDDGVEDTLTQVYQFGYYDALDMYKSGKKKGPVLASAWVAPSKEETDKARHYSTINYGHSDIREMIEDLYDERYAYWKDIGGNKGYGAYMNYEEGFRAYSPDHVAAQLYFVSGCNIYRVGYYAASIKHGNYNEPCQYGYPYAWIIPNYSEFWPGVGPRTTAIHNTQSGGFNRSIPDYFTLTEVDLDRTKLERDIKVVDPPPLCNCAPIVVPFFGLECGVHKVEYEDGVLEEIGKFPEKDGMCMYTPSKLGYFESGQDLYNFKQLYPPTSDEKIHKERIEQGFVYAKCAHMGECGNAGKITERNVLGDSVTYYFQKLIFVTDLEDKHFTGYRSELDTKWMFYYNKPYPEILKIGGKAVNRMHYRACITRIAIDIKGSFHIAIRKRWYDYIYQKIRWICGCIPQGYSYPVGTSFSDVTKFDYGYNPCGRFAGSIKDDPLNISTVVDLTRNDSNWVGEKYFEQWVCAMNTRDECNMDEGCPAGGRDVSDKFDVGNGGFGVDIRHKDEDDETNEPVIEKHPNDDQSCNPKYIKMPWEGGCGDNECKMNAGDKTYFKVHAYTLNTLNNMVKQLKEMKYPEPDLASSDIMVVDTTEGKGWQACSTSFVGNARSFGFCGGVTTVKGEQKSYEDVEYLFSIKSEKHTSWVKTNTVGEIENQECITDKEYKDITDVLRTRKSARQTYCDNRGVGRRDVSVIGYDTGFKTYAYPRCPVYKKRAKQPSTYEEFGPESKDRWISHAPVAGICNNAHVNIGGVCEVQPIDTSEFGAEEKYNFGEEAYCTVTHGIRIYPNWIGWGTSLPKIDRSYVETHNDYKKIRETLGLPDMSIGNAEADIMVSIHALNSDEVKRKFAFVPTYNVDINGNHTPHETLPGPTDTNHPLYGYTTDAFGEVVSIKFDRYYNYTASNPPYDYDGFILPWTFHDAMVKDAMAPYPYTVRFVDSPTKLINSIIYYDIVDIYPARTLDGITLTINTASGPSGWNIGDLWWEEYGPYDTWWDGMSKGWETQKLFGEIYAPRSADDIEEHTYESLFDVITFHKMVAEHLLKNDTCHCRIPPDFKNEEVVITSPEIEFEEYNEETIPYGIPKRVKVQCMSKGSNIVQLNIEDPNRRMPDERFIQLNYAVNGYIEFAVYGSEALRVSTYTIESESESECHTNEILCGIVDDGEGRIATHETKVISGWYEEIDPQETSTPGEDIQYPYSKLHGATMAKVDGVQTFAGGVTVQPIGNDGKSAYLYVTVPGNGIANGLVYTEVLTNANREFNLKLEYIADASSFPFNGEENMMTTLLCPHDGGCLKGFSASNFANMQNVDFIDDPVYGKIANIQDVSGLDRKVLDAEDYRPPIPNLRNRYKADDYNGTHATGVFSSVDKLDYIICGDLPEGDPFIGYNAEVQKDGILANGGAWIIPEYSFGWNFEESVVQDDAFQYWSGCKESAPCDIYKDASKYIIGGFLVLTSDEQQFMGRCSSAACLSYIKSYNANEYWTEPKDYASEHLNDYIDGFTDVQVQYSAGRFWIDYSGILSLGDYTGNKVHFWPTADPGRDACRSSAYVNVYDAPAPFSAKYPFEYTECSIPEDYESLTSSFITVFGDIYAGPSYGNRLIHVSNIELENISAEIDDEYESEESFKVERDPGQYRTLICLHISAFNGADSNLLKYYVMGHKDFRPWRGQHPLPADYNTRLVFKLTLS